MTVVALDPGYRQTAFVVWDGTTIHAHGREPNDVVLARLGTTAAAPATDPLRAADILVFEQMQFFRSFSAGREVFESIFWTGRFAQAWAPRPFEGLLRSQVRAHLGAAKGGDAVVRAALIERFGPFREQAIGTKAAPGPLYGVKADAWSALALAVTWTDQQRAAGRLV